MRVSLYNVIGCGQSRGSQKMAKTRAVLTKGIGDRLRARPALDPDVIAMEIVEHLGVVQGSYLTIQHLRGIENRGQASNFDRF
jgi:hypothetical protein